MKQTNSGKSLFKKGITPVRILPLGFLCVILVGTGLLMLPVSSHTGSLGFFDALFTATSSSCVTGLVVVDTGTYFTPFGQTVLLLLIQLGGLGFMTASTFLFLAMKKRASLKSRMVMAESLGENKLQGVFSLALRAVKYTFAIEGIGALLLMTRFIPAYGLTEGIRFSIFHSVSAFCNAGFDLVGGYRSLTPFVSDVVVNFTIMALITLGGLGFSVLAEIRPRRRTGVAKKPGLCIQSRAVLIMYAILTFAGALLFFLFERENNATIGTLSLPDKLMASLFQSVTCRTAGFNSIDQAALYDPSKLLSAILMFVGGGSAGTAGGIKVTTLSVLFLAARAIIRGSDDVEAHGRSITAPTIRRALCLFLTAITVLLASVTLISIFEHGRGLAFIDILYEVASALGTAGLSVGVTGVSSLPSLVVLCVLMYLGRVGLLTFSLAIGSRRERDALHYPEGNMMIG